MKEVSCRVFDLVLRDLKRRGIRPEEAFSTDSATILRLANKSERIDWTEYVVLMRHLTRFYSPEDYESIGGSYFLNPLIKPFSLVARVLFDVKSFYKWLGGGRAEAAGRAGVGGQMFTCIVPSYSDLAPNRIQLRLAMAPGYEPCPPFYYITKGALVQGPRLFGLPPAQVALHIDAEGGTYEIDLATHRSLLGSFMRRLSRPLAAREIAQELDSTHDELVSKYQELERAKHTIAQQARALETAHEVSRRVHATFDLDRALEVIAHALIEAGGFSYARVDLDGDTRSAERSQPDVPPTERTQHALQGRDRLLGQLFVAPKREQSAEEFEQLLGYVVPVVAMALEEAVGYAELEEYRDQLELKVAQRTEELAEAHDRLALSIGELREAQSARDRFFANINHEVRNPLTLIALAARRLGSSKAAELAETKALLDSVEINVHRLLSLVDGLLLLAASGETKLRLQRKDLDLAQLVDRLTTSFLPRADEAGVSFTTTVPEELLASADEAAIERIIANLVSNALKFTPPGGKVELRMEAEGDDCVLSVIDSGVGLEPEFKDRAFGCFEQGLAPVRPGERGSGIGLAIVQELAQLHGGEASAADNPSGGSIFRVRWPRQIAEVRAVSEGGSTSITRASRPGPVQTADPRLSVPPLFECEVAGAITVLVAEDEPFLLLEIARALSHRFRVLTALDGQTALEVARKHQPSALITDVSMPGMSGFELARAFRELSGDRLAPILFVTAHSNLGDRLEGFESGGVDYVLKPFHPDELLARLTAQLEQRAAALRMEESERLAALGFLTAGLAHEFRNPANAVINALLPLKRLLPESALVPDAPSATLLGIIEAGAAQLHNLSKQITGLSSGPDTKSTEAHALSKIIDRAITVLGGTLTGIEVRRQRETEPWIVASPFTLSQAFANLLENAAHSIAGQGWIEIATERTDDEFIIRVSDSGPGVPMSLRARIFEPFFTTKDPGKGTGLGLPTVKRVVEHHGGELRLVAHGAGTAFEITLPATSVIKSPPKTTSVELVSPLAVQR